MSIYKIWSEGYACTGQSGEAHLHGTSEGKNFIDAVRKFAARNPEFKKYYSKKRNTYWGCRLFATEKAARKSFG